MHKVPQRINNSLFWLNYLEVSEVIFYDTLRSAAIFLHFIFERLFIFVECTEGDIWKVVEDGQGCHEERHVLVLE